jgi:hypothetical protein
MNRGLTNVLLLAVLVGVGLLWSNRAQQASGQTETKAAGWQYKVVDSERWLPGQPVTLSAARGFGNCRLRLFAPE